MSTSRQPTAIPPYRAHTWCTRLLYPSIHLWILHLDLGQNRFPPYLINFDTYIDHENETDFSRVAASWCSSNWIGSFRSEPVLGFIGPNKRSKPKSISYCAQETFHFRRTHMPNNVDIIGFTSFIWTNRERYDNLLAWYPTWGSRFHELWSIVPSRRMSTPGGGEPRECSCYSVNPLTPWNRKRIQGIPGRYAHRNYAILITFIYSYNTNKGLKIVQNSFLGI